MGISSRTLVGASMEAPGEPPETHDVNLLALANTAYEFFALQAKSCHLKNTAPKAGTNWVRSQSLKTASQSLETESISLTIHEFVSCQGTNADPSHWRNDKLPRLQKMLCMPAITYEADPERCQNFSSCKPCTVSARSNKPQCAPAHHFLVHVVILRPKIPNPADLNTPLASSAPSASSGLFRGCNRVGKEGGWQQQSYHNTTTTTTSCS